MSAAQAPAMLDLQTDERWQLVQRIVSSPHFQKSTRLRELLQYIAEQTLHGNAHELTEQHIGNALFHKPSDYSPLEDSSVRVHVRQLRLKLHEYSTRTAGTNRWSWKFPKVLTHRSFERHRRRSRFLRRLNQERTRQRPGIAGRCCRGFSAPL